LRSKTDPLLVDLIEKVMVYSPLRRLTPFEAMSHPYFDDLRD
jgi:glycogen synthase kinase 3 beta